MQHPAWYLHRLRAMPAAEIAWRVRALARRPIDRLRATLDLHPTARAAGEAGRALAGPGAPRLSDVPLGQWIDARPGAPEHDWLRRLTARADAIAAHRIALFGCVRDLGSPIDWHRDHEHGIPTPRTFADAIDYRDVRVAGDAKVVWEPNRHQHLVVLARAYRATGRQRYAQAAVDQLQSWLEQNPFGRGMNWRSPLELGVRLINWIWTVDLILDSGCVTAGLAERLAHAAYLHVWEISRKYSRGSSANNHLIGEAAGVYVATAYLPALRNAAALRDRSFEILCREIVVQTHADGGGGEQAFSYHLFSFWLLLAAAIAGRRLGQEFPAFYWERLEAMTEFAAALGEGGPLPAIGDADDGYVLDLGRDDDDLQAMLSVGAVLFDRADFKRASGRLREPARWLLGADGVSRFTNLPDERPPRLQSRALPESGYYLLQSGTPGEGDDISVVFDCGPLGFQALAAHGHADALSIIVRAFGREVLVDGGTFDYFTYPAWRAYFRSTAAHNTIVVDDLDQSVQQGLFLWGRKAKTRCLAWTATAERSVVEGEHDGYCRLADPVLHRRRVELCAADRVLTVRDELVMRARHELTVAFHVGPDVRVSRRNEHALDLDVDGHRVGLALDGRLAVRVTSGSEAPIRGWRSQKYHVKEPIVSISGALSVDRPIVLTHSFDFK
ncbi:MAG: alginate lyase family protein [Acidobacteria bacterium]|nr:alginate lyase family protein [Acidobacteriota bacterium]